MGTPTLHTKKPSHRLPPVEGVVPVPSKEKNMLIVQQTTDNVNVTAHPMGCRVRVLEDPFAGWPTIANESTPRAGDTGVVVPHPGSFVAAAKLTSVRLDRTGKIWTFVNDSLSEVETGDETGVVQTPETVDTTPPDVPAPTWATVVENWDRDSDGSWERWVKHPIGWAEGGGICIEMLQVVERDGSFAEFGPEIDIDIEDNTLRDAEFPAFVASDARQLAGFLMQASEILNAVARERAAASDEAGA